jgi:glycosyltransferase involved in cell wall biosynthesis
LKSLLITYDLQPPWDSGLKGYGRGLMNSLKDIKDLDVTIASSANNQSSLYDKKYDFVHVVLTGRAPVTTALKQFRKAIIFKHIVTPSLGFRTSISTRTWYNLLRRFETRLLTCFSSDFVASSYSMDASFIIPPSVDTSLFTIKDSIKENDIETLLESSSSKSGVQNMRHNSDGLLLYSGPLTEDRFPYKKVLDRLKETNSKILIIGRSANGGAQAEKLKEIISYAYKSNIENRVTVALKLLNEDEKIMLLNYSDIVIQPFAKMTQLYVAVDPPIFLLEAMACAKPVIGSQAYSFRSLLKNGYNGYSVDWDNNEEIVQALRDCQNNATNLGLNARSTVAANFTPNIISRKIYKMYNDYN